MSIADDLTHVPTRRDRWGRYLVLPPGAAKPVGYTRATTVAKTLDEQSNLVAWKARMVALGLGRSPALLALAASADPDDKKTLNDVAERAAEAGGSTSRRDQGTALHAALEAAWHDPQAAPELFRPDVVAVHDALKAAGLTPVVGMFERMVVVDELQIAGTFDLAVKDENGTIYVADVKTGATLYGALGFAIQLAIYSRANAIYTQGAAKDGSEDTRETPPAFSQDLAYIIHVQPSSGHCDVLPLDLTIGAKGLAMAMDVREIRKAKPLGKPVENSETEAAVEKIEAAFPGTVEVVSDDWRAWMRNRLATIIDQGHGDEIGRAWPKGVPTLKSGDEITAEQGELISAAAERVEANHTMPFPAPEPVEAVNAPQATIAWASKITHTPDEGIEVSEKIVSDINNRAKGMTIDGRSLVAEMLKAAISAETPVSLSGPHGESTERRAAICSALIDVGNVAEDIATAAALIGLAVDRTVDASEIGRHIGLMTTSQAKRLSTLANAVGDPLGVIYQMDGTVEITGDISTVLAA